MTKKKNILAVALLSSALVIGGGVALANSRRAVGFDAAPAMDGTKLDYVMLEFDSSKADSYEGAYYYLQLSGGLTDTGAPGIEMFHQPGSNKVSAAIDASAYSGWTSVKVNRGSSTGDVWQSTSVKSVTANTKNFFKVSYAGDFPNESVVWHDGTSEEKFAQIAEYAVVDGVAEVEALATEQCWNTNVFTPTNPSRVGYSFDGWFTNIGCTAAYTPATQAHDMKLYAKFTTDTSTPWVMKGVFNGVDKWANGLEMEVNTANEVKILDVELKAGDVFKFNDAGSNWYGYSDIKDGSALNLGFEADGSDNIVVKEGFGGSYNFYVTTNATAGTKAAIWITSDDYQALDGWAASFWADEDNLCDGVGDEWSKYATSYAALSAGAKSFFAADKVTASNEELASNIAKAAYRYEYGVAVKGQAAFAETERPKAGFDDKYGAPALNLGFGSKKVSIPAIIIATVSVGAIAAAAGFVFLRKRKNNA